MKIYTEIRFDWNGNILNEVSYEYEGPIAECKGNVPGPSAAEQQYYNSLAGIIGEQRLQLQRQNNLIGNIWPQVYQYTTQQAKFAVEMQPMLQELEAKGVNLQSLQMDLSEQGLDLQSMQTLTEKELWPLRESIAKQGLDLQSMQLETAAEIQPILSDAAKQEAALQSLQATMATELAPLQQELAKQGIDLQALQMEAMGEQIQRNKDLEPALLAAFGLEKNTETGEYTQATDIKDPIQKQLTDLYQRAISGEEPVSPALEKQLTQERQAMENDLSQRLGPDWQQTTSGIQAMSEFDERANLLREESRRGMISTAGAQYSQYMQQKQGGLMGLTDPSRLKSPAIVGAAPTIGSTQATQQATGGTAGGGATTQPTAATSSPLVSSTGGVMAGMPQFQMATFGDTMQGASGLMGYLSAERWKQYEAQQGQQAGQVAGATGGAMAGAEIGSSFGPYGTLIGGGVGALAGWLLSG